MSTPTPPSASPMSDEQEDELDSIIAYINGCTRKPDGTLFLAQADYLKNLIDHHTKEAERCARIDELMNLLSDGVRFTDDMSEMTFREIIIHRLDQLRQPADTPAPQREQQ